MVMNTHVWQNYPCIVLVLCRTFLSIWEIICKRHGKMYLMPFFTQNQTYRYSSYCGSNIWPDSALPELEVGMLSNHHMIILAVNIQLFFMYGCWLSWCLSESTLLSPLKSCWIWIGRRHIHIFSYCNLVWILVLCSLQSSWEADPWCWTLVGISLWWIW